IMTTLPKMDPKTEEEAREQAAQELDQKERKIYANFATPLTGTFLNLPTESVEIKCPACGIKDMSVLQNDLKWWATEINKIVGCFFVWVTNLPSSEYYFLISLISRACCCCCCLDFHAPCTQTDRSHYCGNCGCYFGRSMKRREPLKIKATTK
ncbi:hypothetical protein KR009_001823, partial [Drosophila setifemur]